MAVITDSAWIVLYGNDFSPYQLSEQTGLSFEEVVEKGVTLQTTGPHQGGFAPYGWARSTAFTQVEGESIENRLLLLLSELYDKVGNRLADFNIESISVWLVVKHSGEGQHGFEIGPQVLLLIGQLSATLCIDYML
ncbi:hypothetical protein [Spirosoma flavum]|uniref:DUF4279 domain-containing protein n=1 Tax=Spirosoma flavum TaxID=2048557 RepID=A0ABW6ALU1_9BACT